MNNKGQTLVLFVALLPFVFILFVFAFDLSFISSEKTKLDSIAKSSLKSIVINNKDENEVKSIILKNDKDIKVTYINSNSICLLKKTNPIFGNVIGYKTYKIKVCKKAKYINGKLIIEEKGK